MPIPTADAIPQPRRLLRDVAYDEVLAAIMDGTLEPGERLNDDELATWLQVSRTPIREAIARLHALGLVEIEANRFTRVASRDDQTYVKAAQVLAGLHRLGAELSAETLDDNSREVLLGDLSRISQRLEQRTVAAAGELLDAQGVIVAASGNELLIEMEASLRVRVKFLGPRETGECDWPALRRAAQTVRATLLGAPN